MDLKRKLVIGAAGLVALSGIGTGVAFAQSSPDPSPPKAEATVPDTDNVQQGNPNGPETPDANAAPEAKGAEAAEPANDPDPGHQDPDGANVDYTPAGEQPEPATPGAQG